MALPTNVTSDQIRAAAQRIDAAPGKYRPATKFAVVIDGRPYAPKAIIAEATGIPTTGFSGGPESNRWLSNRGFTVKPLGEV